MNFLEVMGRAAALLKEGAQGGDWGPVAEAYKILTGEVLEVTPSSDPIIFRLDRIEHLLRHSPQVLAPAPQDFGLDPTPDAPRVKAEKRKPKVKKPEPEPRSSRPRRYNTFVDDLTEAVEEIPFSRSQKVVHKTYREPPVKVAVTCSLCSRQELMDAALAPKSLADDDKPHWICDGCLKKGAKNAPS